jgi:hypothetical protein
MLSLNAGIASLYGRRTVLDDQEVVYGIIRQRLSSRYASHTAAQDKDFCSTAFCRLPLSSDWCAQGDVCGKQKAQRKKQRTELGGHD